MCFQNWMDAVLAMKGGIRNQRFKSRRIEPGRLGEVLDDLGGDGDVRIGGLALSSRPFVFESKTSRLSLSRRSPKAQGITEAKLHVKCNRSERLSGAQIRFQLS